uniref:Capsid protein alpha n=1 Tax=Scaphoideus titanus sobemo-like virus 2 TaxID=2716558 RepID=A0A6G7NRN4_9VIRU|nr:hypothetical protein [Scaphoideus titanus sobemo-like virus 2]
MSTVARAVKCTCGRSFATKAAMQQHKRDGCRGGQRRPAPKSTQRQSSVVGAPVSQAVEVRETSSDSASVSGVDRLEHIDDISKYEHGVVVIDDLINASSFARLSKIAGAYQKVRYRKLAFRVVPMVSTSVGGGYVVAFVRDPADVPPTKQSDLLNWITSQSGSVTTKWWESTRIQVPTTDRVYYTSTSQEVREYSPGRLVLAVDGKATAPGPVTIFVDWSVTLTHASLESTVVAGRPDHTVLLRNIWTKDQNQYAWSYDPTKSGDSGSPNPELMFSDWQVGDLYLLPSAFTLEEYKSGTTGDAETDNFWVLHVESNTGVRWRIHPDTTDSGKYAADAVLIMPRGTVLRRIEASKLYSGGENPRELHSITPKRSDSEQLSGKSSKSSSQLTTDSASGSGHGTQPQELVEPCQLTLGATWTALLTELRRCSQLLEARSGMRRRESGLSDESQFEEVRVPEDHGDEHGC